MAQAKSKRVLVCGGSGFIGSHLVRHLINKDYWVRSIDIKDYQYGANLANEFLKADLTSFGNCLKATEGIEEVYQLAANMGGMGYISKEHIASFYNSDIINAYMAEACKRNKVKKVFFSSSVCVYPTHLQQEEVNVLKEEDSYPANPNEAYGWEKLFAERRYMAYQNGGYFEVRIARFENTYGPYGTYEGGREKAPAALCRKAVLANSGESIEVWGDGKAMRPYTYIGDLVEGISRLMDSTYILPVNLGSDRAVSVDDLASIVIKASGKKLSIKHVEGPQGVRMRYIDHSLAKDVLRWSPKTTLESGIEKTYEWIKSRYEK